MDRVEIKKWAKEKIKENFWELLVVIIIGSMISGLTIVRNVELSSSYQLKASVLPLSIFFYFVEVGLTFYMVKFVEGKKSEFKDLFHFANDYVRIFLVNILQLIFVILWGLLLIIPGIIKAFAYALVPYLLADKKYNDLSYMEVLKKSEEIMKGHKMDLFVFELSFFGWYFLSIFTLGLLFIWIIPYYNTAKYKFLNDIKKDYEKSKKHK